MFGLGRGWPRIDYGDADLVDQILDGLSDRWDIQDVRLVVGGLLDISGAAAYPGRRTLWTWLAAWCAGAGPEHAGTCARIAWFTERWHDIFERQPRHVSLGLAPASDEQLAQIRGHLARQARRPAQRRVVVDSGSWLTAGEQRFEHDVSNYYGSPETIARGGVEALERGDTAAALFFFQKSIDLLHTLYVSTGMQTRRPGHRDNPIIDHYLRTLGDIRRIHPDSDVTRSVIEVTHRLRTISTTCRHSGAEFGAYLRALRQLGEIAPDIDVSGVFWQNPSLDDVLGDDFPREG